MSSWQQNHLQNAASTFLRSAAEQPVWWHPWGRDALELAQRLDRPVLLDVGATWCQWCHVMDRESYADPATADLINKLFVAIRVDRDERPDLDGRLQAAVAAISGQGGWPLTVFLTPEGKPYFGGGYFAPDERVGRPAFGRVLRSMAEAYRTQRAEVMESAESVMSAVESGETFQEDGEQIGPELLERILGNLLAQVDSNHGGFGSQPKFPFAGALDLLLDTASRPGPFAERARDAALLSLRRMAQGGFHDQLGGGFHRYSVDERWGVPHFEKMSYDNAELLRTYAHAAGSFADPQLLQAATGIVRWMDATLSDPEQGGFFASQEANAAAGGEGEFYTWTRDEAAAVLTGEEFSVLALAFDLRPVGDMQDNPAKNVLRRVLNVQGMAQRLGMDEARAESLLQSGMEKLLLARTSRPQPPVDQTLYTGWNGLCISGYLAAGRSLGLPEATGFALRSLDRILTADRPSGRQLGRVIAYGSGLRNEAHPPALLDDYAFVCAAALDAWEVTGEMRYFQVAQELVDEMLRQFHDPSHSGFFDTAEGDRESAFGILAARRKPVQDAPTPAANSLLATLLLRMHALTGSSRYREIAQSTLQAFAGVTQHLGLYAAAYGVALQLFLKGSTQICVIGDDKLADELTAVAQTPFQIGRSVVRLRRDQLFVLPPALANHLPSISRSVDGSFAVICLGTGWLGPVRCGADLQQQLHSLESA